MTGPTPSGLFDARGCLTAAGLAALERAQPGAAPAELAAHVGSCGRCQQHLLSSLREPGREAASRKQPPSGSRMVWMVVLVLGGLVALLAGLLSVPFLGR